MAYEVLGDEKKRKVYDRYGLMGLQMYSSYASAGVMGDILFNPVLLCVALMFITLLITIAILFPAFLAVKIDGLVTWSWAAVFAPLWVLDIIALLYFVRDICSKEEPEHREAPGLRASRHEAEQDERDRRQEEEDEEERRRALDPGHQLDRGVVPRSRRREG